MPPNFAQWNVGDIILDLYKVNDILGEGGFGKVYKVRHQGWNIDLAVKIPKPEIVEAAGGVENFEREAETWVNLGLHPHTVSCYYVRRIDNNPVVFAEYVAGGSLHDWIYSRSLYAGETETSLKRILDIAIQFAWGLHYAHKLGLIHQDVKPANVMMTAEGVVKVTDFGLANYRILSVIANDQERQAQTSRVFSNTLMVAGSGAMTPAYCSPEQANGNNLTRRTDLWSWALSVLEMFQGELTWRHGTVAAGALEYYLEQGSEYPHLPQMPILLAQLLRRCFRENPDERPHDMLEVANELQEIYQQVTAEAYPQQHPQTGKEIADSFNNRAVSLFDLGRKEEALRVWEQALQVQPQHPESTYNRGLVLWRSGEINDDTLVEALNNVQQSYPRDWTVKYLFGLVHLERDDCKAAIEILESIQGKEAQQGEVKAALVLARKGLPHSRGLLNSLGGHTGIVYSVCLSVDGRFALSGSADKTLKLWELSTGQCLRTLEGHTGTVYSVSLSADNQFALSGSSDGTLNLWELSTGQCLRTFEGHTGGSLSLSADNQFVLSASAYEVITLKLWEVSTGCCLRTHTASIDPYDCYSFGGLYEPLGSGILSADNQFALSGSHDKTLKLWEVATGKCLRTFDGLTDSVTSSLFLSADNQFALSGSHDKTLKLWEVATGKCLRTFEGHTDAVCLVCLSADKQFALSRSSDRTLKLWEVSTGRCLSTFEDKGSLNSKSLCLSSDNQFALSGSDCGIRMWAVNSQKNLYLAPVILSRILDTQTIFSLHQTHRHGLEEAQIALDRQDYIVAAYHIRKVRSQLGYNRDTEAFNIWKSLYIRLPRKKFLTAWESPAFKGHTGVGSSSLYLSGDNQFALSGSETLKLWELTTGRCLGTFNGHIRCINSVSLSTDGILKLWEVATGSSLLTFGEHHGRSVESVCLSADNQFALSGSFDATLKLWEVETGRCLRTLEGSKSKHVDAESLYIPSLCLSVDNKFALSGSVEHQFAEDGTLKLWEVATGKCLRTFKGHQRHVSSVCLSADNQFALSGSYDGTIKLWEVATGKCLRTFEGHIGGVSSVCLSADKQLALSGGADKTLKLWEIATGLCLHTFGRHTNSVSSVCLSADNQFALSGSSDGTLKLWFLDWELEDKSPADWDEGARPYLENFLTLHTPYATTLPKNRAPLEEEITQALTRHGIPTWSEDDFQNLLYTLGCVGYGWLRPKGVRQQLEIMTIYWKQRKVRINIKYQGKRILISFDKSLN